MLDLMAKNNWLNKFEEDFEENVYKKLIKNIDKIHKRILRSDIKNDFGVVIRDKYFLLPGSYEMKMYDKVDEFGAKAIINIEIDYNKVYIIEEDVNG